MLQTCALPRFRTLIALAALLLGMCCASPASRAAPPADESSSAHAVMGQNPEYGRGGPSSTTAETRQAGSKIWGYDISQYQGSVNFVQLKSAASFVVIRCDYGAPDPGQTPSQYQDKKFAYNRSQAEQQGMITGFYHYAYPEYNSATAEANCFADNIGSLKLGEFVVLDFEETYAGDKVAWCRTWMDTVQSRLGVRPLLYINYSTEKGSNWSPVISGNYGLWLALWDFNRNAAAPATQWPFVALRQYSDNESVTGISGAVDGDVFYGTSDQLKSYGYAPSVVPAYISWTSLPSAANRWYRDAEQLVYQVSGDRPNTVHEMIDGVVTATKDTSGGSFAVNAQSPGWHTWEVTAANGGNAAGPSDTGPWAGGWDPNPPTVTRTGGAAPSTWYQSAQSVTFQCADALAGVRQFHYQWDANGFSPWIAGSQGSATLPEGKHHLYVEVEDNAYTGSTALGNRATVDLGEFWLNTAPQSLSLSGTVLSTDAAAGTQVRVVLTNPTSGTDIGVGVDRIQLGTARSTETAWDAGNIDPGGSVAHTFTFPTGFGSNKSLLLSANVHYGTTTMRLRTRIPRP